MVPTLPLLFRCDQCGGNIQTTVAFEGKSAPCPICSEVTTAPRLVILPAMPAPHAVFEAEPHSPLKVIPAEAPAGVSRPNLQDKVTTDSEEASLVDIDLEGGELRIGDLESQPRQFKSRRTS